MSGNILALILLGLFIWLLAHLRLRRAVTGIRRLVPVFAVLALFLLVNAVFAYMGRGGLELAATAVPVTAIETLEGMQTGEGVLLVGSVSADNPTGYGDYVAYMDDSHLWSPSRLKIDLDGGAAVISNDTYALRNWPTDAQDFQYIRAGQPVTVVGYVERSVNLLGPDQGEKPLSLRADLVYAGQYADFVARAERQKRLATGLVLLNLLGAGVAVALPLGYALRRNAW